MFCFVLSSFHFIICTDTRSTNIFMHYAIINIWKIKPWYVLKKLVYLQAIFFRIYHTSTLSSKILKINQGCLDFQVKLPFKILKMGRNEDIFWNKITCIVFLVFFLGSINIFTSLKITYLSACDIHRKIDSKPWIISILWSKMAVFKRDGYNKESNATPNDFLSINFLM